MLLCVLCRCKFRICTCKYSDLGCNFSGLASLKKAHEKICPIQEMDLQQLAANVKEKREKREEDFKKEESKINRYVELSNMLEKRCRNIIFKDIVIERDELCEVNSSQTFTACSLAFQVLMQKTDAGTGVVLKLVEPVKHKVSLQVVILRGPQLMNKIEPTIHKVVFKRKMISSDLLMFPLSIEEGSALFDLQSVHLRY